MDVHEDSARFLRWTKPKLFIRRVHSGLRDESSAKHYEPVLLSIGLYHRRKTPVKEMENYKHYYVEKLPDGYLEALTFSTVKKHEDGRIEERTLQAIDFYPDTFQMDGERVEECMVRDGCFMIELFCRNKKGAKDDKGKTSKNIGTSSRSKEDKASNDMIFDIKWMKPRLARDILLFENQIPLFVLRKLFELTVQTPEQKENFSTLALEYFEFNGSPINGSPRDDDLEDIPHLLGLVYHALVPERLAQPDQPNNTRESCEFIRTAVALNKLGVKFAKATDDKKFFEIDFNNGELSIPRLIINENTESFFRNLVAYEEYSEHYSLHRVADYLRVMDCLINSYKDVELLRHHGIIDNRIGDDVKVSTMFNNLCSGVYFDQGKFFYANMFDQVNKFSENPWNMWLAMLRNDYFGSPWSKISVAAALTLLVLTAVQTVYSVLGYYK